MRERAEELAQLGFTTIWMPPPTKSVSPEVRQAGRQALGAGCQGCCP